MGQSSLPILNKAGRTISWSNTWDDLKYYSIKFEEDIFLKIFFELFFSENLFKHKFYLSKNYLLKLKNFYLYRNFIKPETFKFFKLFLSDIIIPSKIIFYFMKFHILRVESTTIIILKLFFPINKKKKKKKKSTYKRRSSVIIHRFLRVLNFFFEEKKNTFNIKNF